MGLDTTAYRGLEFLRARTDGVEDDELYEREYTTHVVIHGDFPHTEGSMVDGFYRYTDSLRGPGSSYGGYSEWRAALCRMIHGIEPEEFWRSDAGKYEGTPFFELINFSDCEGTISPEACVKLAKDFAEHAHKASAVRMRGNYENDYFAQRYRLWQRMFEWVGEHGCVRFH
jgi:hypothetical protein